MEKLGIENRSMHAGNHKAFIDPFSAKDESVRAGRGDRIKETYSGLFWLDEDAVINRLIDELNDLNGVSRDVVETPLIRIYEKEKSVMKVLIDDITAETSSKLALYLSSMR